MKMLKELMALAVVASVFVECTCLKRLKDFQPLELPKQESKLRLTFQTEIAGTLHCLFRGELQKLVVKECGQLDELGRKKVKRRSALKFKGGLVNVENPCARKLKSSPDNQPSNFAFKLTGNGLLQLQGSAALLKCLALDRGSSGIRTVDCHNPKAVIWTACSWTRKSCDTYQPYSAHDDTDFQPAVFQFRLKDTELCLFDQNDGHLELIVFDACGEGQRSIRSKSGKLLSPTNAHGVQYYSRIHNQFLKIVGTPELTTDMHLKLGQYGMCVGGRSKNVKIGDNPVAVRCSDHGNPRLLTFIAECYNGPCEPEYSTVLGGRTERMVVVGAITVLLGRLLIVSCCCACGCHKRGKRCPQICRAWFCCRLLIRN